MKNLLFGSMIFFFLTLSFCAIVMTRKESKVKVKTVWQQNLVVETTVNSVEEAVDFILEEDSIILTRDHIRYLGR